MNIAQILRSRPVAELTPKEAALRRIMKRYKKVFSGVCGQLPSHHIEVIIANHLRATRKLIEGAQN